MDALRAARSPGTIHVPNTIGDNPTPAFKGRHHAVYPIFSPACFGYCGCGRLLPDEYNHTAALQYRRDPSFCECPFQVRPDSRTSVRLAGRITRPLEESGTARTLSLIIRPRKLYSLANSVRYVKLKCAQPKDEAEVSGRGGTPMLPFRTQHRSHRHVLTPPAGGSTPTGFGTKTLTDYVGF
jgi:hypothetical protein